MIALLYESGGGHKGIETVKFSVFQWTVDLKSSSVTTKGVVGVKVDQLTSRTCLEAVLTHLRAIAVVYPCFCYPKSERVSGVFLEKSVCVSRTCGANSILFPDCEAKQTVSGLRFAFLERMRLPCLAV